jgi:superfamily I DNA/RNA helicase
LTIEKYWGLPGTGKTMTALDRVREINTTENVHISNICVCTFRRPMADSLVSRLEEHDFESDQMRYVSTIHGVCRRLLMLESDIRLSVVKEKNRKEFCDQKKIKFNPDPAWDKDGYIIEHGARDMGHALFELLAWLEGHEVSTKDWRRCNLGSGSMLKDLGNRIPEFLEDWTNYKMDNDLLDFSDILRDVRENGLVPPTKVLVVDEFQDLTRTQFEIFKMWVRDGSFDHVIIAGDKYQSIYSFFGGDPRFFDEVDGDLTVLSASLRLPSAIWETGRSILSCAGYKDIPEIDTAGTGMVKRLTPARYRDILNAYQADCFHLVRCNYQAGAVGRMLEAEGIPFEGLGGWSPGAKRLYNVIVRLRRLYFGGDVKIGPGRLSLLLEVYPRKYWAGKMTWLKEILAKRGVPYDRNGVLGLVAPASGFWEMIMSTEPFKGAKKGSMARWYPKITRALENFQVEIRDQELASVQTIHGSKGSERDVVFLHTTITKKIGTTRSSGPRERREEARVFFVGATRARETLYVVDDLSERWRYPLQVVR